MRSTKMNALAAAALALAAAASPARAADPAPAPGQRPSPEVVAGREAMILFHRMCMMSGGHRQVVEPLLDGMPDEAKVRRMPVDRVARLHGGKAGGAGWTVTSPNGNEVVLDFSPDGPCSARVKAPDASALESDIGQMMGQLVRDGRSTFAKSLDERRQEDGGELHRVEYLLQGKDPAQGIAVTVAVATTTSAAAEYGGVLTFTGPRPRT